MSEQMVALFEGDAQGSGLTLLARTRDPRLVRQVRSWFAKQRRADASRLAGEHRPPVALRPVPAPPGDEQG